MKFSPLSMVLFSLACLMVAGPARAQNSWSWTPAGVDNNWSDAGNWTPAGGIVSGPTTQLTFIGTATITSANDLSGFTLNLLDIEGNPALGVSISGNSLTFADSGTTSPGIALNALNSGSVTTSYTLANDLVMGDTLTIGGSSLVTTTLSGTISGTGGLFLAPGGDLILGNAGNSYFGGTLMASGTVTISTDGDLGDPSGGVGFAGGVLESTQTLSTARPVITNLSTTNGFSPDGGTTLTLTGSITENGSFVVMGPGTVIVTGTVSTATGGATLVSGGTLVVGGPAALGTGELTLQGTGTIDLDGQSVTVNGLTGGGGTVTNSGSQASTLTVQLSGGSLQTLASIRDGTSPMALAVTGNGGGGIFSEYLQGGSTYSGGTSVTNALVELTFDTALGAPSGTVTLNGNAGLFAHIDFTTARNMAMTGTLNSVNIDTNLALTLTGTISGTGPLLIGGAEVQTGTIMDSGGGTIVLTGSNTFTGGETVMLGTLQVASDANLGEQTGTLTIGDGTFEATGSITMSRPVVLTDPRSAFQIDNGATLTLNGPISSTASFIFMKGNGTMVLAGDDQSYGVIQTGGAVYISGTSEILTGGAFSARGGQMYMTGSVTCLVQVEPGGALTPGPAAGVAGTITTSNVVELQAGGTVNFALGQTTGTGSMVATGGFYGAAISHSNQAASGTVTVNLSNSGDAGAGTYQLITGPNMNGATAANFALGTTLPGLNATFNVDANGVSVTLAVPPSGYSGWEATYFPGDPVDGAPTATPQGDGVPNLLKYTYDINPTGPMVAADRAALPTVTVVSSNLVLTYRALANLVDVTVQAQVSSDLQNWTNVSSTQVGTDPVTMDPIFQASVPVSGTKQFLRLAVTQ